MDELSVKYKVKDINFRNEGNLLIEWASNHMPVLNQIMARFEKDKPLNKVRIGACLHVTKETGMLMKTLKAGGGNIALCASNPLSTQDSVAAAIADWGVKVYAWRQQTKEEYYWCIDRVIEHKPQITLDDGADLVGIIHSEKKEYLENVTGGTEETTTGVIRLRSMEKKRRIKISHNSGK